MLGWGVTLYKHSDEEDDVLAGWIADPGFIRSMGFLESRGDAVVVSLRGGYPDEYRVKLGPLRDLLLDADPLLCRDRQYELYVDWNLVDALGEDEEVYLSMWDQS